MFYLVLSLAASSDLSFLKPRHHARPEKNWINDPNGPCLYKGTYHLFMQYNPNAAIWGNMSWYHMSSKDLIRWTHHPLALEPSESYDLNGCFSGSVSFEIKSGRPFILYTGQGADSIERQVLAVPMDDDLIFWTKMGVVIDALPSGFESGAFRDPSDATIDDEFLVGINRSVLRYSANDFSFRGTFYSIANNSVMECPERFQTQNGEIGFKYSEDSRKIDWLEFGKMDGDESFHPRVTMRLDEGSCVYASKSFSGKNNERVYWSWLQEERGTTNVNLASLNWSGAQSLPKLIRGTMLIPHPNTKLLLNSTIIDAPKQLLSGRKLLTLLDTAQFAVFFNWTMESFSIEILNANISFAPQKGISIDRRKSQGIQSTVEWSSNSSGDDNVEIWVDGSILEIFFSGKVISTRIYPENFVSELHVASDISIPSIKIISLF